MTSALAHQYDLDDEYDRFHFDWCKGHLKLVEGLEKTFEIREFEKSKLELVHVNQENIVTLCKIKEISLPKFWFDELQQKNLYTQPEEDIVKGSLTQDHIDRLWSQLNHKQKARLLSRETAKIIWADKPPNDNNRNGTRT